MNSIQALFQSKIVSAEEALSIIKDGDTIGMGGPSNLPVKLLESLHLLKDMGRTNLTVFHASGQVRGTYPYLTDPAMKGCMHIYQTFYNHLAAEMQEKNGVISLVPYQVYRAHKPYPINVFMTVCTPPDKHGYVRMSLGCLGEGPIWRQADRIIAEVNYNYPHTYGDVAIPVEKVDCFIEGNNQMIIHPEIELNDAEIQIGKHVASLVENGSTIQLGIGGIPNAASNEFRVKNDLGVHTEMITTNMARLAQEGVITGRRKTINPEKMVGSFAMGSQLLYDFIDENPVVEIRDGNYVNNPFIIAQHERMVSVNAAVQVDLGGQVCSESFGAMQYSGIGGAMNFAQGAHYSKDGKAIVALKSTAKKGTVSTIQAMLTPGSVVSIPRTLVDYIVTEYGIAKMGVTSMQERVENLIQIAHPKFRDELRQQAHEYKITNW